MSRRTVLVSAAALALLGGVVAPGVASAAEERDTFCVVTAPKDGSRDGLCVWLPLPDVPR